MKYVDFGWGFLFHNKGLNDKHFRTVTAYTCIVSQIVQTQLWKDMTSSKLML